MCGFGVFELQFEFVVSMGLPNCIVGRGIITATRESPFSSLKKKKKKNLAFVPFAQTFQQNVHVLKLFREMPLFMELEFYVKFFKFLPITRFWVNRVFHWNSSFKNSIFKQRHFPKQ